MKLKKVVEKTVDTMITSVEENIVTGFEDGFGQQIKEVILEDYDLMLNGVADPRSEISPEKLMSEFRERLDKFEFFEKVDGGVKIVSPDIDNFPLYGKLRPIENILEGLVGVYKEVNGRDYRRATGTNVYRGTHMRLDVTYLFKNNKEVKEWENALGKEFKPYAFSNSPPIDIFRRADDFIEDNIDTFIDTVIEKSEEQLPKII